MMLSVLHVLHEGRTHTQVLSPSAALPYTRYMVWSTVSSVLNACALMYHFSYPFNQAC